jgi:hypothetical protein
VGNPPGDPKKAGRGRFKLLTDVYPVPTTCAALYARPLAKTALICACAARARTDFQCLLRVASVLEEFYCVVTQPGRLAPVDARLKELRIRESSEAGA